MLQFLHALIFSFHDKLFVFQFYKIDLISLHFLFFYRFAIHELQTMDRMFSLTIVAGILFFWKHYILLIFLSFFFRPILCVFRFFFVSVFFVFFRQLHMIAKTRIIFGCTNTAKKKRKKKMNVLKYTQFMHQILLCLTVYCIN